MKPRFMILFCEVILLLFLISSVCALSDSHNLTVPDDFNLINESVGDSILEKTYSNNHSELITVTVQSFNYSLSDCPPDDVKTVNSTINDHNGLEWKMDGEYYFIYFEDNDLISIKSSNKEYFEMVC